MSTSLLPWAAALSIAVAAHHWRQRHDKPLPTPARHIGLALGSLMMSGAHGVATMLAPALMPLCTSSASTHSVGGADSWLPILAAVGLHAPAMFAVTAVLATLACRRRKRWLNRLS